MVKISISFGQGGVSVARDFEVAPRRGDLIHIQYGEDDLTLLVDMAQHTQNPDSGVMEYFLHGKVIKDFNAEVSRQLKLNEGNDRR